MDQQGVDMTVNDFSNTPLLTPYNSDIKTLRTRDDTYYGPTWCCFSKVCYMWTGATLLFTLGVGLIVMFAGGAAISQKGVDHAGISLLSMNISNIKENKFTADLEIAADNRFPFAGTVHSHTYFLNYNGVQWGEMPLPKFGLAGAASKNLMFTDREVTITDQAVFDQFATAIVQDEEVIMGMQGHVTLEALGISYKVNLNQEISSYGLNNLEGNNVVSNILIKADKTALSIEMMVDLYNPSVVNFDNILGLNLTALYEGVVVGYGVCMNDTIPLTTGTSTYSFHTVIEILPVAGGGDNRVTVEKLLSAYANGEDVTVGLQGNEDSCPLPILKNAVSKLNAEATFNGLATVIVMPHPNVTYFANQTTEAPLASIPPQSLASYTATRGQGKDEQLFAATFGIFDFPGIVVNQDPVACGKYNLTYSDVVLLLNNPLGEEIALYNVHLDVFWEGDAALNYSRKHFAWGDTNHTDTPYIKIAPFGTAYYKQRLCLDNTDPAFLGGFLTNYLPTKMGYFLDGAPDVTPLLTSEQSIPLKFGVSGTFNASVGPFFASFDYVEDFMPVWVIMKNDQ